MTYRTFIRSARSFEEFASARKRTVHRGLSAEEALRACKAYNEARTGPQVRKGTKMEFERE